jgi:hypothetical protein
MCSFLSGIQPVKSVHQTIQLGWRDAHTVVGANLEKQASNIAASGTPPKLHQNALKNGVSGI